MQNRFLLLCSAALLFFATACTGPPGDGETPSRISGFFTAGHQHTASNGDAFMAIGMVVSPSIDVEGALEQHFSDFKDTDVGSCSELPEMVIGDASTSFFNAGVVSVSGPGGSVDLQPFLGLYIGSGADSLFQPGAEYTIRGDGSGDLAEFEGTADAPERLTLTSPDPTDDITITRTQDLALTWTSSGSDGDVFVSVEQEEGTSSRTWICKFEDTGSASIPTSVLGELQEDTTASDTEVVVYKYAWSTFEGPGLLSPFGTLMVSETRLDAIVE